MSSPHQQNSSGALSLRGVAKSFGREEVLQNLNLDLKSGELTLLLGQNGCGKSTLLRIAAGLCRADGGTVNRAKEIGYVGHHSLLYGALTVRENLALTAELLRCAADIDSYAAEWELTVFLDKAVWELSKGQQARAALARAMIQSPRLLLLDEPTSALDEGSAGLLLSKLKALSNSAILIATHDVARLESRAQRAVVLSDGAIAFDSGAQGGGVSAVVQKYRELNR